MCGIVGFITKEVNKGVLERQQFMRDGLIMDTLRGADATGIFMAPHMWHKSVADHERVAYTLKDAVPGHAFVTSTDYSRVLYPLRDWSAVVGHNRAATRGKRDAANAHPFQEGPVTLVHNGTLTSTYGLPQDIWSLNKALSKEDEITVDSHVLCHNLAVAGVDDVPKIIKEIRGAFALVWHDARDDSINIIRNSQRPLHLAYVNDEDTLYFMSESEMLYALARRTGIKLGSIFYPKPGVWMKWLPNTPLRLPIVKELELHVYKAPETKYDAYAEYDGVMQSYGYGGTPRYDKYYRAPSPPPEVPPVGKSQAVASLDDRVLLLGRRRDVPRPHMEALRREGLFVSDRVGFLPHQPMYDLPKKATRLPVVAQGELYGGDYGRYSAVVFHVPDSTYRAALSSKINERGMWTVRPVGVSYMADAQQRIRPVILCHLVRPTFTAEDAVVGLPELDGHQLAQQKTTGPKGINVSQDEFQELVAEGCTLCSVPLGPLDADTVAWVDDYPVCGDCWAEEAEALKSNE